MINPSNPGIMKLMLCIDGLYRTTGRRSIDCLTGSASTIASVRGSRRIWMNSFTTTDQTRAVIGRRSRTSHRLVGQLLAPDLDSEHERLPRTPDSVDLSASARCAV